MAQTKSGERVCAKGRFDLKRAAELGLTLNGSVNGPYLTDNKTGELVALGRTEKWDRTLYGDMNPEVIARIAQAMDQHGWEVPRPWADQPQAPHFALRSKSYEGFCEAKPVNVTLSVIRFENGVYALNVNSDALDFPGYVAAYFREETDDLEQITKELSSAVDKAADQAYSRKILLARRALEADGSGDAEASSPTMRG